MAALVSIFSHSWIMTLLIIFYAAVVAADLFKRRLLSKPGMYEVTMLLSPFAALTAVGTPIAAAFTKGIASALLTLVFGAVLMILAAAVYIRGHIVPADKSAGRFSAAKRLIVVGAVGTAVYGVLTVVLAYHVTSALGMADSSLFDWISLLFTLAVVLLIPIFNVIALGAIITLAAEFAAVCAVALLALLMSLLTANGCIRYIITADMTKGQKALRIILSLIPIVNIFIGIGYCKKMREE